MATPAPLPPPEAQDPGPTRSGDDARLSPWRVPPIDTYPKVVAFAQTLAGKLLLFAIFAALMKPVAHNVWTSESRAWLIVTVAAAAVSLAGRYRRYVLLAFTAAFLAHVPGWFNLGAIGLTISEQRLPGTIRSLHVLIGTLIAFVPLAAIALYLARRFRADPVGRRPVLAQHILYFCLLGLAVSNVLRGIPQVVLWSFIATYSAYFGFLAYALIDQRHREPAPMLFHFATFNPFLWGAYSPMGKGADAWSCVEAGSAEELAVTQLKAIKLLAWALFLKVVQWVFHWVIYGRLGVPPLPIVFEWFLAGRDVPAPFGLVSIIVNFPDQLLGIAIWGHVIVASARLAGFRLLRNTYRPLSSRTIAEFWNRYYYFYKELLVDVYFYPTYLRCFKRHPRLRLAFATFMAAGVGNFFFHFILESSTVAKSGLIETLTRYQTFAFYCVVLSTGIVISQLHGGRPDPTRGWMRGRLVPAIGVALFFGFLSFFDGPQRHVDLIQHFKFLFHVFGVARWIHAIG
jgi:hypothetical protein